MTGGGGLFATADAAMPSARDGDGAGLCGAALPVET